MKTSGQPGILAGAAVGAMMTAALIAVFFGAWRLTGLPFVPFDVFDWFARVLPDRVITFGISPMVAAIRGLGLGPTSAVAKGIEQAMEVAGLFFTGVVGGAVLFGILRRLQGRYPYMLSLAMGLVVGTPVMLISRDLSHTASTSSIASALWILAVFLLWGIAFGWAHWNLWSAGMGPVPLKDVAPEEEAAAERVDRRQFLIRLGGATAAVTVVGAIVGVLSSGRRNRQSVSAGDVR